MQIDHKFMNLCKSVCIDGIYTSLLKTIKEDYGITFEERFTHGGIPVLVCEIYKNGDIFIILPVDEAGGLICESLNYNDIYTVINWFKDINLHNKRVFIVDNNGRVIGKGMLIKYGNNSKGYLVKVRECYQKIEEYNTYYVSEYHITTCNGVIKGKAVSTRMPLHVILKLIEEINMNISFLALLPKSKALIYSVRNLIKEVSTIREINIMKSLIMVIPSSQNHLKYIKVGNLTVGILEYSCKNGFYSEEVDIDTVKFIHSQLQAKTRNT